MGSQACKTFKSMTKLNKSVSSILQAMNSFNYCRTIISLIQHNSKVGLLLFIHCLLLVPLAVGSYDEFLVYSVVLSILSSLAIFLLNASCNINLIQSVFK